MPTIEVQLNPFEEYRFPDELPIEGRCFKPGKYEIRFYYKLGLLPPEVQERYAHRYSVVDGGIAYEDRGHTFVVK